MNTHQAQNHHPHSNQHQLKSLFNAANKIIENSQVGNYFPPKIYTDVNAIKWEKSRKQNNYKKVQNGGVGNIRRVNMKCKKNTFLEAIQKRQRKLPAPNSYKPVQYMPEYKKRSYKDLPERVTIFQQQQRQNKKSPIPSSSEYKTEQASNKISKFITLEKNKSSSLIGLKFQSAQNGNYVDGVIYNSAQLPGIGEYHVNVCGRKISKYPSQTSMGKFDKGKARRSQSSSFLSTNPSPFTYNPKQLTKNLFSQITLNKSKAKSSVFDKQKRFNEIQNQKNKNKNLFYTGVSQWGIKKNNHKKDLLNILSKHNIYSKSVYYR